MKRIFLFFLFVTIALVSWSQDLSTFHAYHPEEDAIAGVQKAVKTAAANHKNVFLEIGGNWCIWCARFYELSRQDRQIDSAFNANFIV